MGLDTGSKMCIVIRESCGILMRWSRTNVNFQAAASADLCTKGFGLA